MGEETGRKYRKVKRQIMKSFRPRPCPTRRWHCFDWILFICAVVFIIYAIISISFVSTKLHWYRNNGGKVGVVESNTKDDVSRHVRAGFYNTVGVHICISLLIADLFLLWVTVFICFWIRQLRNSGYFVVILILLILALLFYISLGISVWHKGRTDSSKAEIEEYAFKEVSQLYFTTQADYAILRTFFHHEKCCGMRSFRDFNEWKKLKTVHDNHPSLDLPQECCRNHSRLNEVNIDLDECGNSKILDEKDSSTRLNKIWKIGCGAQVFYSVLKTGEFLQWSFHTFTVAFFIFAYIMLLLVTLCCFFEFCKRKSPRKRESDINLMEQEDGLESEIIPGTPAKSMMSESENTFYAP